MSVFSKSELQKISHSTVLNYSERAYDFWEGTKDHDVTQNIEALLEALPAKNNLRILDFGCGPGRDLVAFKSLGHDPVGLDGCQEFCKMARAHSDCEVLCQDFLQLDLPPESFDGIFANATLFHIPKQEFVRVMKELHACLKPHGVLFASTPRGHGEGWSGDRFANLMEIEEYSRYVTAADFEVLHHYYRPTDRPPEEQPWLAVVSRKV